MYIDPTYIPREMWEMFLCDFCGQTKGGEWVKTYELTSAGSLKCKECIIKVKKKNKEIE